MEKYNNFNIAIFTSGKSKQQCECRTNNDDRRRRRRQRRVEIIDFLKYIFNIIRSFSFCWLLFQPRCEQKSLFFRRLSLCFFFGQVSLGSSSSWSRGFVELYIPSVRISDKFFCRCHKTLSPILHYFHFRCNALSTATLFYAVCMYKIQPPKKKISFIYTPQRVNITPFIY